jgi:FlaA1/EpsC-like NDP-sugar epimerase
MFCPICGTPDQKPETFCHQCGLFLPDFNKLIRKETTPEEHLSANSILNIMTAIVSGTLAILLHAFYTGRENPPPLIIATACLLSAMFCWQVQTIWRTRQLKRQLSRRKKKEKVEAEAFDNNPLIESTKTNELLSESDFRNASSPSIIENTTRNLGEKVERKPSK